ncbi:DUF805 domain-containing protein [Bradyrhizobium algeriense]|uniref:DUF805 domain-containing protein n=1 Tax=Bradyrhizobium algeriense TaxID=634784 RepID=UPI000D378853|nr:DUF805 domain-containing protein [Bradyrhizobium algeriense]
MLSTFSWFFLSFSGRSSRQEFWLGYIGSIAVLAVLIRTLPNLVLPSPFYYLPGPGNELDFLLKLSTAIALFIVIWPLTAIFVKRLHDFNVSGWWLVAMAAIPPISKMTNINLAILHLVVVAVLGFIPGARGNNRFGVDPVVRAGI